MSESSFQAVRSFAGATVAPRPPQHTGHPGGGPALPPDLRPALDAPQGLGGAPKLPADAAAQPLAARARLPLPRVHKTDGGGAAPAPAGVAVLPSPSPSSLPLPLPLAQASPPNALHGQQSEAAPATAAVAKQLAVKQQVDALVSQLPQLQQQRPEIARQIEDLAGVFNHALLASDVYADHSNPHLLPAGYSRLSPQEMAALNLNPSDLVSPQSGYVAAIYKAPTGRYVVANRGTTSGESAAKDWKTNIRQGAGRRTSQYDDAIRTALKITAAAPGQVDFVGHSKGGGLAQAQALATHSKAVVFNAAALHGNTLGRHGLHSRHANGLVSAYNVGGEVLNRLQDKTPGIVPSVRGGRYELPAVKPPESTPAGLEWGAEMGKLQTIKNAVALHSMDSVIDSLGWQLDNLRRDAGTAAPAAKADRDSK